MPNGTTAPTASRPRAKPPAGPRPAKLVQVNQNRMHVENITSTNKPSGTMSASSAAAPSTPDIDLLNELNMQLRDAILDSNLYEVNQLLEKGANVNIRDTDGISALMHASDEGLTDIVRNLLNKGANTNLQNNKGKTALMYASEQGYAYIIKLLLEKGANIDLQNNQLDTALMFASVTDHKDCVRTLLERGANIDLQNKHGSTALILASSIGNADIVKLLLDNDAHVYIQNEDGKTAYDIAVDEHHAGIADMLKGPTTSIMPKYRTHKDIAQDAFSQNPPTRPGEDNAYRLNNLYQKAPPKTSQLPKLNFYKTPTKLGTKRRNRNRRRSTRRRQ